MRTILVDDENWNIVQLQQEMMEFRQINIVGTFENPWDALNFAEKEVVEFALLDIEMPEMSGMELGRKLRQLYPDIILIYLTGYEEYLHEAIIELKADYYLLKPYTHADIEQVVERATALSARLEKNVNIRTFGGFEVYIHGQLVHFTSKKAKELLALCIFMEGGHVSMEKAVDTLWEDKPYDDRVKSLYRKAVIYLNSVFREYEVSDVFENGRGYCCVHTEKISCDYMDYLEGKLTTDLLNKKENFLPEYTWAEGALLY